MRDCREILMSFRFYTDLLSQTSKSIASGIFTVGLFLIGFGVLIYVFPAVFALLAALVFFIVGGTLLITACKIFWRQGKIDKMSSDGYDEYRKNVRIHHEEDYDI